MPSDSVRYYVDWIQYLLTCSDTVFALVGIDSHKLSFFSFWCTLLKKILWKDIKLSFYHVGKVFLSMNEMIFLPQCKAVGYEQNTYST